MTNASLVIREAHCVSGGDDSTQEARARRKSEFPGRSARRMTHLGMLIGHCIQRLDIRESTPVVYASAYAESSSLENFIDSFPQASPMLFQTSIHPSAVEQALITHRQPIRQFYPITSECNLAGQALENAIMLGNEEVAVVAGEERGSWLCPFGLASEESFALGLSIAKSGEGIGEIRFEEANDLSADSSIDLPSLYESINERRNLQVPSFALGEWIRLDWT